MTFTKAAFIAAKNYLIITRISPGGQHTQAGRIYSDALDRAAAMLAAKHGPNTAPEEYSATLIASEDLKEGRDLFRPIPVGGPDLTKMSSLQLHEKANIDAANRDAANRQRGGK